MWVEGFSTSNGVAGPQAAHICAAHKQVAESKIDDRTLRIAESRRIDDERENLEKFDILG